jgi:MFS family permease
MCRSATCRALRWVVGLARGRCADTHNRLDVIAAGIVILSIATAACGYVGDFEQFFIARTFVGIGEAALAPAITSPREDESPLDLNFPRTAPIKPC